MLRGLQVLLVVGVLVAGLLAGYFMRGETHHYFHVPVTTTETSTVTTPFTVTSTLTETTTLTETLTLYKPVVSVYRYPDVTTEVRLEHVFFGESFVLYVTNTGDTTLRDLKVFVFYELPTYTIPAMVEHISVLQPGQTYSTTLPSIEATITRIHVVVLP